MKSVNANKINRKSGEAEGSAVLFPPRPLLEVFFDRARSGELALSEVEGDLRFLLPGSRDDKFRETSLGMLPKTDPGALGSLDFLRALPLDHSTFVTVLHLSELHLNLTGEFMKAYCVILCSHSFINPTSYPRTKRFYVGALTANRAIRKASELNPEFRVLGIEHSDLRTPSALS